MKKYVYSLLVTAVLFFGLYGCGSSVDETNNEKTEQISTDIISEERVSVEEIILADETEEQTTSEIPPFSGKTYVEINGNIPQFSQEEYSTAVTASEPVEICGDLDNMGRCTTAFAIVSRETMPTEERGQIGEIKPSGWHTVKYNGIIDGNYLYNRCHLLGFQLTGENANPKNLITGTRYFNVEGMLPFEDMVAEYVSATDNHVAYKVTPVFEGENLVATGVQMQGFSLEDEGTSICFNVFVYNVQPGIGIDYASGDSWIDPDVEVDGAFVEIDNYVSDGKEADSQLSDIKESDYDDVDYILNTNTGKFHYPDCESVKQMKEKNKAYYMGTRDEIIVQGYEPCRNCRP